MSNFSSSRPVVDDRLEQVERADRVRHHRLVRPVPRLADVRLGAEVEDVRPVGRLRRARGRGSRSTSCRSGRRSGRFSWSRRWPMLFSAPLEVARTKAWTFAPRWHERVGQVRAHEAVGAGDEDGAAARRRRRTPSSGRRASAPSGIRRTFGHRTEVSPPSRRNGRGTGGPARPSSGPSARAEEALPRGRDRALGGREVAEAHPAADPLALPLAVRHLLGELAGDGGAEADRPSRAATPASCAGGRRPRRRAACTRRPGASGRRSSGAARGTTSRASGTGRRAPPSTRTRSSGRGSQSRRTSAEEPIRKVSRSVEIPRRSHSTGIRSASSAEGVTASWSAPRAAKTIVLAPAPVSSVAIPGWTVRSM